MLIESIVWIQDKLNILIGIVIAAIILAGVYVGYHASLEFEMSDKSDAGSYDITIMPSAQSVTMTPVHVVDSFERLQS